LPWPNLTDADAQQIEGLTRRAISLRIQHRGIEETSRIYVPSVRNISYETQEEEVQKRISEIVAMAFGLTVTAFSALQRITNIKTRDYEHEPLEDENANGGGGQSLLLSGEALVSHCVGVLFGRWDVRITLDPSLAAKLPDPFDPLPICPPGMLIGPAGLPAESGRIVSEEWLRARPDANTLPPQGSVKNPTIPDDKYPHCVSWEGLQVDDPGFGGGQPHKDDIVRRVREVLDLLFKDKAHDIEQITCDIIGVSDLREYFQKSTGFFQDHLKRYSKSRRKAPIYWRLSTSSGNYSVWLYYHRLTKDALYKVLNEYISPKIEYEERSLTTIMQGAGPMPSASQRKEIDDRNGFLAELRAFRDEIVRIAPLWNPELNDGVVINYAPLWRLVSHHRAWQKDLKECWDSLVAGEYEWSHLAMHLWPERIVQKCADDPSLAIAHGLENLFLEKDAKGKWKKRKVSSDDVKGLVTERTSSSVKAALNDLLFAAGSVENGKRTRKPRAKSTSKGKA
jgi:hypothetical protein